MTMTDPDQARAERILRERLAGEYVEWGKLKFDELRRTRDEGRSLQRVRNPYLTPATSEMLKGIGRNELCPCGSGRKTKWCCAV